MIPRTLPEWQKSLQEAVTSPGELLELLSLPPETLGPTEQARAAAEQFPLRVPRRFVRRMVPGDPEDPLLRQVLPRGAEAQAVPGYSKDPLKETGEGPAKGVLHKYRRRVLLVVTGSCGIHCRYCFRRHFPYAEEGWSHRDHEAALELLRRDPTIEEVILSGGDPLTVSDRRLAALAEELAEIPHLKRLRIHSRMPVLLPERIDGDFLRWFCGGRLKPVMVVHSNHPRELDAEVRDALGRLRRVGATVLNQSVLLRGVNDRVETLKALSEELFEAGALPYYLHLLDPVAGAAHFDVPEEEGRLLVAALAACLPGYLVPRLVREVPGAFAKVPVDLASTFLPSDPNPFHEV